jgi:hypothetical protein
VVRPEGFEPPTPGSEDRCSIQLSYGRMFLLGNLSIRGLGRLVFFLVSEKPPKAHHSQAVSVEVSVLFYCFFLALARLFHQTSSGLATKIEE